jgi:hypothetical protein
MIYHIYSNQDATIYEKEPTLNAGLDEILELEKNVIGTSEIEVSRILINFNVSQSVSSLRAEGLIPTGSLNAVLKLYSLEAVNSPVNYSIECYAVSQSWTRGTGKFSYIPFLTNGVSWKYYNESSASTWPAGNISSGSTSSYSSIAGGGVWYTSSVAVQNFTYSPVRQDINLNVTSIVDKWLSGSLAEYGFIIKVTGSLEYSTQTYGPIQFFSNESNTVYVPRLELGWDDSVFNTGSLQPITTDRYTVISKNLNKQYDQNTIDKINIVSRPMFPVKTLVTGSAYNVIQYLPQTSYYAVEDYYTGELLVPFSNYTKISASPTGNYFNFNFNILQKNRFYRFIYKINKDNTIKYFKSSEVFNVI